MKKRFVFIFAIFLFLSFNQIQISEVLSDPIESSVFRKNKDGKWYFNFNNVETVGNHSFIPLDLEGTLSFNRKWILKTLNAFEEEKKLTIINYNFETTSMENTNNGWGHVNVRYHVIGIWVIHRPQ